MDIRKRIESAEVLISRDIFTRIAGTHSELVKYIHILSIALRALTVITHARINNPAPLIADKRFKRGNNCCHYETLRRYCA